MWSARINRVSNVVARRRLRNHCCFVFGASSSFRTEPEGRFLCLCFFMMFISPFYVPCGADTFGTPEYAQAIQGGLTLVIRTRDTGSGITCCLAARYADDYQPPAKPAPTAELPTESHDTLTRTLVLGEVLYCTPAAAALPLR